MEELLKSLLYPAIMAAIAAGLSYVASRRIQNADVAAKYQDIARKQAEDNIRLEKCQDELEARITELEKLILVKDGRIARLEAENNRIATLEARVTELETENATLKSEIEALQRRRK